MHLDPRPRRLCDESSDPPGLVPREVMGDGPARGQPGRILVVYLLRRRFPFDRVEACLSVGMTEAFLEQARRTRMVLARTRPEDATGLLKALVGDAVVVGD